MFDWHAIYKRFSEEYGTERPADLATMLGITKQSVHDWKNGVGHVPWRRMKKLVEENNLRWDWLIEGKKPKFCERRESTATEDFDWNGIKTRFFSLFPGKPQHIIAKELGVSQETVSKWYRGEKHVPWKKLKYGSHTFTVSWEWLINGEE